MRKGKSEDWRPPYRKERRALPTGEDIERALHAAERLLVEGDNEARHLQNIRFGTVSLLIVTLLSVVGLLIGFVRYEVVLLLPVAAAVGVPVAVLLIRLALRPTRGVTTELAAQIAGMVDEAMTDVAEREQWSRLRVEATRLRLSAFPLAKRQGGVALVDVEDLIRWKQSPGDS